MRHGSNQLKADSFSKFAREMEKPGGLNGISSCKQLKFKINEELSFKIEHLEEGIQKLTNFKYFRTIYKVSQRFWLHPKVVWLLRILV